MLGRTGAGEVFDPQEQEKVAAEIETFLKVSRHRDILKY